MSQRHNRHRKRVARRAARRAPKFVTLLKKVTVPASGKTFAVKLDFYPFPAFASAPPLPADFKMPAFVTVFGVSVPRGVQ